MLSKKRADFVLLFLTGAYLLSTFIICLVNGLVINLNNYLALTGWTIVLIIRIVDESRGRNALGLMLLLAIFQLLNFGLGGATVQFGLGGVKFNQIGFNFAMFLIGIAFYIVNRKSIHSIIRRLLYGDEGEQQQERNKKIEFYKKRFSDFGDDQLERVYQNINLYPEEAQVAIRELRLLRNS